jgi:His-Xaa-Ser system protein HxsD
MKKKNNSFTIHVDGNYYSDRVITKCVYWLSEKFLVSVKKDNNTFYLEISNHNLTFSNEDINQIQSVFFRNLNDFKTRELIDDETRDIKNILLIKALSHGIETDNNLISQIFNSKND